MNEEFVLPFVGIIILITILTLGIFSIKIILFPNKTYREKEEEKKAKEKDELIEALNSSIPKISDLPKKESQKKILETVDNNIKKLKEIEMNDIKIDIKQELLYQKNKKNEEITIKINLLKKEEQQKCLINYFETIKRHINKLSDDEIQDIILYIEKKF
ncbi:MAG: hypothetical protein ACRDAQ_03930 [Cetobacterium sp.]